jgi:hypothetical protein
MAVPPTIKERKRFANLLGKRIIHRPESWFGQPEKKTGKRLA